MSEFTIDLENLNVREIARRLDVSTSFIYSHGIKDEATPGEVLAWLENYKLRLEQDARRRLERAELAGQLRTAILMTGEVSQ